MHASQPEVLGDSGCCLYVPRRALQSEPCTVMPDMIYDTCQHDTHAVVTQLYAA